jgi:CHAD domain-containing protein
MKSLKKFSKSTITELVDYLDHFSNKQDPEILHEIRVDVKKIKTVLNAVSFYKKKFKAHQAYLPFRNIFRKAGAIREPEVLNKISTEYSVSASGKENSGQEKSAVEIFIDDVPFFIKSILQQWKRIKPLIANIHRKELNEYMRELKKRVQNKLTPKPKMADIHKTRKAIKEILYLSKITGRISKRARTFYSDMEEVIGQWHDKQTLLNNVPQLKGKSAHKNKLMQLKKASLKDQEKITQLARAYY